MKNQRLRAEHKINDSLKFQKEQAQSSYLISKTNVEESKDYKPASKKRGKVYNWETATYGKIWDNKHVHDLGSVETEFPAIVFSDTLTSKAALSCEPTVSSLHNDEIDFRISFDESDDEDCTVIFDKNSFSYKIISVNDLKTVLENDNDKVNMPLLPSPEPMVSSFDDLDYFKDFKKEFPAIVYNDAQTSKLDFDLVKEISTNIGGEFKYLEILKYWSLETSRHLFNTILLINAT
ncbi:hypothetical protein Tco_0111845 [Tanacetum coccineum]